MAFDSTAQVFLVRKSAALQRKVLSVRVREDESGAAISHFPVRENQYSKYHVNRSDTLTIPDRRGALETVSNSVIFAALVFSVSFRPHDNILSTYIHLCS